MVHKLKLHDQCVGYLPTIVLVLWWISSL